MKKKLLSALLIVVLFMATFNMVAFAEEYPNVIKHFRFSSTSEGWFMFETNRQVTHTIEGINGYISGYNENTSWRSPAVNIYEYIRLAGPGTYTINARLKFNFSSEGVFPYARMIIRTDRETSFTTNTSNGGRPYGQIGIDTYFNGTDWTNFSGSFKVYASDLERDNGVFDLCFDNLFEYVDVELCIDDVIITKLSEDNITNGDFSDGTLGWRNWGGYGNFDVQYVYDNDLEKFIYHSYYIKASTYGSLATNVDQIIAKYGCTRYRLSFKLKMEDDAYNDLNRMVFYLTKNNSEYHYWIDSATKTTMEEGEWLNVTVEIDMAKQINGTTLYEILAPYSNCVYFRLEYRANAGVSATEEKAYYITDVSFEPVAEITSVVLDKSYMYLEKGWKGYIGYTLNGEENNTGISWVSSNEAVATVNANTGYIRALSKGVALIFAVSNDDNTKYAVCSIQVVDRYLTPVILLHGRMDNSANTWGAANSVQRNFFDEKNANDVYGSSISLNVSEGLPYTSYETQKIQSYQLNNGNTTMTVPAIFNGNFDENGAFEEYSETDDDYQGNLAYYLVNNFGYTLNVNLFVFNYPNEDSVVHNAMKLKAYIDNLITYVREEGSPVMKTLFFPSDLAYEENDYKINIVGHSMGGLVARYYIENCTDLTHYTNSLNQSNYDNDEDYDPHSAGICNFNDDHVEKLITIGTPHWGSLLANASNITGALHKLCDHDLASDSRLYGNETTPFLTCNFNNDNCSANNYRISDALNYTRERSTKYYAVAGIDFISHGLRDNDFGFELPTNIENTIQLSDYINSASDYQIFKLVQLPNTSIITTSYIDAVTVSDNTVSFLSQIGWGGLLGNNVEERINMYKIYVDIDSNDLLNENNSVNHLHGKIPHRIEIINKVAEYLGE